MSENGKIENQINDNEIIRKFYLKRIIKMILGISVPLFFFSIYLLFFKPIRRFDVILEISVLSFFFLIIFFAWHITSWKCPVCKNRLRYSFLNPKKGFLAEKCLNCGQILRSSTRLYRAEKIFLLLFSIFVVFIISYHFLFSGVVRIQGYKIRFPLSYYGNQFCGDDSCHVDKKRNDKKVEFSYSSGMGGLGFDNEIYENLPEMLPEFAQKKASKREDFSLKGGKGAFYYHTDVDPRYVYWNAEGKVLLPSCSNKEYVYIGHFYFSNTQENRTEIIDIMRKASC